MAYEDDVLFRIGVVEHPENAAQMASMVARVREASDRMGVAVGAAGGAAASNTKDISDAIDRLAGSLGNLNARASETSRTSSRVGSSSSGGSSSGDSGVGTATEIAATSRAVGDLNDGVNRLSDTARRASEGVANVNRQLDQAARSQSSSRYTPASGRSGSSYAGGRQVTEADIQAANEADRRQQEQEREASRERLARIREETDAAIARNRELYGGDQGGGAGVDSTGGESSGARAARISQQREVLGLDVDPTEIRGLTNAATDGVMEALERLRSDLQHTDGSVDQAADFIEIFNSELADLQELLTGVAIESGLAEEAIGPLVEALGDIGERAQAAANYAVEYRRAENLAPDGVSPREVLANRANGRTEREGRAATRSTMDAILAEMEEEGQLVHQHEERMQEEREAAQQERLAMVEQYSERIAEVEGQLERVNRGSGSFAGVVSASNEAMEGISRLAQGIVFLGFANDRTGQSVQRFLQTIAAVKGIGDTFIGIGKTIVNVRRVFSELSETLAARASASGLVAQRDALVAERANAVAAAERGVATAMNEAAIATNGAADAQERLNRANGTPAAAGAGGGSGGAFTGGAPAGAARTASSGSSFGTAVSRIGAAVSRLNSSVSEFSRSSLLALGGIGRLISGSAIGRGLSSGLSVARRFPGRLARGVVSEFGSNANRQRTADTSIDRALSGLASGVSSLARLLSGLAGRIGAAVAFAVARTRVASGALGRIGGGLLGRVGGLGGRALAGLGGISAGTAGILAGGVAGFANLAFNAATGGASDKLLAGSSGAKAVASGFDSTLLSAVDGLRAFERTLKNVGINIPDVVSKWLNDDTGYTENARRARSTAQLGDFRDITTPFETEATARRFRYLTASNENTRSYNSERTRNISDKIDVENPGNPLASLEWARDRGAQYKADTDVEIAYSKATLARFTSGEAGKANAAPDAIAAAQEGLASELKYKKALIEEEISVTKNLIAIRKKEEDSLVGLATTIQDLSPSDLTALDRAIGKLDNGGTLTKREAGLARSHLSGIDEDFDKKIRQGELDRASKKLDQRGAGLSNLDRFTDAQAAKSGRDADLKHIDPALANPLVSEGALKESLIGSIRERGEVLQEEAAVKQLSMTSEFKVQVDISTRALDEQINEVTKGFDRKVKETIQAEMMKIRKQSLADTSSAETTGVRNSSVAANSGG